MIGSSKYISNVNLTLFNKLLSILLSLSDFVECGCFIFGEWAQFLFGSCCEVLNSSVLIYILHKLNLRLTDSGAWAPYLSFDTCKMFFYNVSAIYKYF